VRSGLGIARLACVAALCACGGASANHVPVWEQPGLASAVRPEMGPPQPGDLAPALELPRTDGAGYRLADSRGTWVLLHFTASWCPFCDAEVEHLGDIARAYANRNVKVVLVDVQEEQAHWLAYAKEHVRPEVIALHDASGDQARHFAPPHAQPSFDDRAQVVFDSTLIVDPQGRIRLFLLANSEQFDPKFLAVRRELDRMLAEGSAK
jgi:peroxiredoxin